LDAQGGTSDTTKEASCPEHLRHGLPKSNTERYWYLITGARRGAPISSVWGLLNSRKPLLHW
jgi:hypothetical protein